MDQKITPMMQQWHDCKKQAHESLLLFRLGDFYEAFYEDAKLLSEELDLTLTQRQGIPMSGIPAHSAEGYLEKLIQKGHKIAIAEQTAAGDSKSLFKREIVRTISPATYFDSPSLLGPSNCYFAAIIQLNSLFGLSIIDLSTSEFKVIEFEKKEDLLDELIKRRPKELLVPKKFHQTQANFIDLLRLEFSFRLNVKEDWAFDYQICFDTLARHFQMFSLDGFGLKHMTCALQAAGGLFNYLKDDLQITTGALSTISPLFLDPYMSIDASTFKHLHILGSGGDDHTSLLSLLNRTKTAMGSRLLRNWVSHPLLDLGKILERQEAIECLLKKEDLFEQISLLLKEVKDVERLIMKIASGSAGPRDVRALALSLKVVHPLAELLKRGNGSLFDSLHPSLPDFSSLSELIENAIVENPPLKLHEGGFFKKGYNSEIDAILDLKEHSEEWLAQYQENLRKNLGTKTLKVGFHRSFGYFIEVSRLQADQLPPSFYKKQTLVNTERFSSKELQEFEEKILHADEKLLSFEQQLFKELIAKISIEKERILEASKSIATVDSIHSLALVASHYKYRRPKLTQTGELTIRKGRHPLLERTLTSRFISNNTDLGDETQMMLITGPNMAGKSTYIRQVALLVIMAQMGSYLPVEEATIGLIDRVFSRIGASDDLGRGQSTFMVEMTETSNILRNCTSRSLVILDEIGRGTSTYDGVAIAWSVAEYLLSQKGQQPKTLFATHYHELTALAEIFPTAKNFRVDVDEENDQVTFLHKIVPGGADKSYGIHVAKLAGLPLVVIQKAKQKLQELQEIKPVKPSLKKEPNDLPSQSQLFLFPLPQKNVETEKLLRDIKQLDLNTHTPLEVMHLVMDWQKKILI